MANAYKPICKGILCGFVTHYNLYYVKFLGGLFSLVGGFWVRACWGFCLGFCFRRWVCTAQA